MFFPFDVPSPATVKSINKHAVLDLIRFQGGGISRVEAAQKLGMTRAAISLIVSDLLDLGLVREAEHQTLPNGGRPPRLLEINPEYGKVIGIDLGASHVTVLITNVAAQILYEQEVPMDIAEGPEKILDKVDELVQQGIRQSGILWDTVLAVGLGVPGPIDSASGMVISPPIMPGWDRYPIRAVLEERWRVPVSLNNDAELGAIGEWAFGAGRGERFLAYIKAGSGIGAGLLLDGKIYRGATGSAGEIGHLTIDENGPQCTCGNYGCVEAYAGGKAIARAAREAVQKGLRTQLSALPLEAITALEVANAARRGDFLSQQIIERAGEHLGIAIAGVVNLFNPSVIIIGGGVAQIGDLYLEPVRRAVQKRSLSASARAVRITTALLGRRSSAMGAVVQAISLALHQAIEKEKPFVSSFS
jgi:glucokinase-like ROK family protein